MALKYRPIPGFQCEKERGRHTAASIPIRGRETLALDKSELTCSVCLEQFKDPKVLPCCHTFCKQCLLPLVRRSSANPQRPTHTASVQACAYPVSEFAHWAPAMYQQHSHRKGPMKKSSHAGGFHQQFVHQQQQACAYPVSKFAHCQAPGIGIGGFHQQFVHQQQQHRASVPAATPASSDMLSCPKCRAEHEVPKGGVDGFLTNFSFTHKLEVAAVVKEKKKRPSCGQCESSDPSVAYCVECEAFLCEFCSSAHKRMKSYKEHNVLPLDKITSDTLKPSAKPVKCSKHPEEDIKLYCTTCQQLICRDCTLVEHRSHSFHFANEARQSFETNLVKLAHESKKKLAVYEKELQEVQHAEQFLLREPDKVKEQIRTAFDVYISALQSRRATLLAEVDSEYQADSKKVWAHKEFTETAIADITASLRFAEQARKCSSDAEMISLTKQAIQHLKSLNTREHKVTETKQVLRSVASYQCSHLERQIPTCDGVLRQHTHKKWHVKPLSIRVNGEFSEGDRVRPGPDWRGEVVREGTVIEASVYNVKVKWDDGSNGTYTFISYGKAVCPVELVSITKH